MTHRILYCCTGMLAGLSVPLGQLLWRAYNARRDWWSKWVHQELARQGELYLFLTIVAVIFFAFLGYLLGKRHDDLESDSQSVENQNLALAQLATTDALTGLFNARHIREILPIELENSRLTPLTCMLADIDHFKKINDEHGHPIGDQVLIHVAKLLKKAVRRMDIVGRLGGEEFMLILPGLSRERAVDIGERIRETVAAELFVYEQHQIQTTISLGVVTHPLPEIKSSDDILKAVDQALYEAKHQGRNRLVVWQSAH